MSDGTDLIIQKCVNLRRRASWDGDHYAYTGNIPLSITDPTGMRPVTDADLKA